MEHMGNPGLSISSFRAPQPPLIWSASTGQAEVNHNPCKERVNAFHSSANGKNPVGLVLSSPATMEVDPAPAIEKMLELLSIMILALSGIALGLTIGSAICWAWNSNYLRNFLTLLFTSVRHGNEAVPKVATPVPMANIHEGSSDDSEDDDTVIIVLGQRGTWLLSQVSGPAEQVPGQDQAQQ